MTTINKLYAEDIYLKGKPLGLNGKQTDLTEAEHDITSINAVILGLFGGSINTDSDQIKIIKTTAPTKNDDANEGYSVGSIWITSSHAYICLDDSELKAVWKRVSVQINDTESSTDSTYSSHKLDGLLADLSNDTNYKLGLEANITDVNTLLTTKASMRQLTLGLFHKEDIEIVIPRLIHILKLKLVI